MDEKSIAKLTLSIPPEALQEVIASGRLLEFADALASNAALQIQAQVVNQVAEAAIRPDALKAGSSVKVGYIWEGGDFGTLPPRPKWGIRNLEVLREGLLRRIAGAEITNA
jgi:hypothetical protein